jgi:thioredoxin-dependent peroxiredoxin
MPNMLPVGAVAPDFDLPGVDGRTGDFRRWTLREFRGQPVVLLFYPGDGSPVCMRQLSEYTAGISAFDTLDAQVLAVSHQSPESHLAFAERNGGFAFPMLADEDKAAARSYGVLGLLDLYRRCTFVIGPDGVIRYSHRYVGPGLGYRPVEELVDAVAALTTH